MTKCAGYAINESGITRNSASNFLWYNETTEVRCTNKQKQDMIGKLFEVMIPFFLQLALGFAVLMWVAGNDEKDEERRKRYNNKRTRE